MQKRACDNATLAHGASPPYPQHARPDRDDFISINCSNIEGGCTETTVAECASNKALLDPDCVGGSCTVMCGPMCVCHITFGGGRGGAKYVHIIAASRCHNFARMSTHDWLHAGVFRARLQLCD